MAHFDWFPFLQGKYMTYYQIFALIFSLIVSAFSAVFFFLYLILSKLTNNNPNYQFLGSERPRKATLEKLKGICFNMTFYCLSLIPVVCSALDVLYVFEGMLGMFAILMGCIFLDNGRRNWN